MKRIKHAIYVGLPIILCFVICKDFIISDKASGTVPPKRPLPERRWGEEVNGCLMAIEATGEEFSPCMPVIFKIYIRNIGKRELMLERRNIDRDFVFEVKNEKGQGVSKTRYGKQILDAIKGSGGARIGALGAGEEQPYEFRINQLYHMTVSGTYSITAKRMIVKRDDEGNSIQIEVRGKKPNEVGKDHERVEITSNTIEVVNGGAKPRRVAGRSKSAALCKIICRNRHDKLILVP